MGKSRRGSKEFSREQKLIHENKALKKQVSQLRKQLARLDLDRYDTVREMIEEHSTEYTAPSGQEILDNLKKSWACNETDCGGHLEIFLYNKLDQTWYYRICSNAPACKNRTKAQRYSPEVKGIMKKSSKLEI